MKDSLAQFKKLYSDLQAEKARLETRLKEINVALGAVSVVGVQEPVVAKGKNKMSEEGRRKIAAAQKKRWAKFYASNGKSTKAPVAKKAKRKMSAEGRARIVAAQKARWAKIHAQKAKK